MRAGSVMFRFGALLGLMLALAGCTHYQWGTSGHLAFNTLYIEPVKNKTMIPQLAQPVSSILREEFLKDGRVTLVDSPESADATLKVTISQYHRDVAAVREQDTGLASKFSVTVATVCTLENNRGGRNYFTERVVETKRDVFVDNGNPHSPLVGDQLQAEYNLVPIIGQALAHNISHTVLDVW